MTLDVADNATEAIVKAGEAGGGASTLCVGTTRNVLGAVRVIGDEILAAEGVGRGGKAAESSVVDFSVVADDSPVLEGEPPAARVSMETGFFSAVVVIAGFTS